MSKVSNYGVRLVSRGAREELVASHLSLATARRIALKRAAFVNYADVVDLSGRAPVLIESAWLPKGYRAAITTTELADAESRSANHPN